MFDLWPENADAFGLFVSLWGQWDVAVGFASVAYTCIPAERIESAMRMRGVKKKDQWELFVDINTMVGAARNVRNRRE